MVRGHAYIQKNISTENIGGSGQCQILFYTGSEFRANMVAWLGTEYLEYRLGAQSF